MLNKNLNYEDPRNIDRFIFTVVVLFSEDTLGINDYSTDISIMNKMKDLNNPIIKWVSTLIEKYDVGDLIDEHILGETPPATKKECERRLLNFFKAMEKRTGYSPEQAMADIRKLLN